MRRHIYGLGIDEPAAMYLGSGTTTRRFYMRDPHGSAIGLTTGAGSLAEGHSYFPFGRPDGWAAGSTGNPLRYAKRPYDAEIGLCGYRARICSRGLRRFLPPPDRLRRRDEPLCLCRKRSGEPQRSGRAGTASRRN